jgi:hypothetical protein
MKMSITGRRSELGALLAAQGTAGETHFNVAGQQANTLLHDGHAWRDFSRTALAAARRARQTDAGLLVHASFALVHGCPERDPLRSIAQTILECEDLVLAGPGNALQHHLHDAVAALIKAARARNAGA